MTRDEDTQVLEEGKSVDIRCTLTLPVVSDLDESSTASYWIAVLSSNLRKNLRNLLIGFGVWTILISVYLSTRKLVSFPSDGDGHGHESDHLYLVNPLPISQSPATNPAHLEQINATSPFTGVFSRFPRISALPERQRRITMVGAWNDDAFPAYLHHHLYSIQLNADVLDLLLINRKLTPKSKCLDFEKAGANITWGGNIKVVCIDDAEWKKRHVDFMCDRKMGWHCNTTEYEAVTKEFNTRPDESNYNWRPFRGYAFRDLFPNPENPFWAWIDHDVFLGNFGRYPFNVLSQLSVLTGSQSVPEWLFMAGQLTAFNFDDQDLASAWKRFPELKTPTHFTHGIDGKMPESSEEQYWSYGYLRSTDHLPGFDLSYGVYPDIHGDDYFESRWRKKNTKQTYVVSGREILLVETSYTRDQIEELIKWERDDPIDDLGSIGWTEGEEAIVEEQPILIDKNCSETKRWKQCVKPHPLSVSQTPTLRSSLIRFKWQDAGYIYRRLERDTRPRGYERKLIRHHLKSKHMEWFELPSYAIKEDMVLRYNNDEVEVWRMGKKRDKTLFFRKEGEEKIG